eukprot:evm.model.scf_3034.1 EVM.evm.TU.scf_3034.1   scf_3034:1708-2361(-)
MALPFDTVACSRLDDGGACGGCGWKCGCFECAGSHGARRWQECQCPCRFWVVICFVVLAGFFVVFYVATVFRKTLLYGMASVMVAIAAALSALAAGTDECGWPAFFSISLVFAFPCLYSCCWQFQARRRRRAGVERFSPAPTGTDPAQGDVREAHPGGARKDQGATVVMVFPDGDVMLGLEERKDDGKGERGGGERWRAENGDGERRGSLVEEYVSG